MLLLQMSTKNVVGQEVLSFKSVGRIAKLLDQLADGLSSLDVLRAFLEEFVKLFTYTASVTASDVLDAIYVQEGSEVDHVVMLNLQEFVTEASEEGVFNLQLLISCFSYVYLFCA